MIVLQVLANLIGISTGGAVSYFAMALMDGITLMVVLITFHDNLKFPQLNPGKVAAILGLF